MKKLVIGMFLLFGTIGYSQVKNDTIVVIRDKQYKILDSTTVKQVVKKMDSLYYLNPLKNNELCVTVYVNGKENFHLDFKRKEEKLIQTDK